MAVSAMDLKPPPNPPHVVVAGGGVAALEAVVALRAVAGPELPITLLAPERQFVHRPSSVMAPFGFGPPQGVPLQPIATNNG